MVLGGDDDDAAAAEKVAHPSLVELRDDAGRHAEQQDMSHDLCSRNHLRGHNGKSLSL